MAAAGLGLAPLHWSKPAAAGPKARSGGLNYANLQDKYILILLEYKLMPQLSAKLYGIKVEGGKI